MILPAKTTVLNLALGHLRRAGLDDQLVAEDVDDYAAIAARLANDAYFRQLMRVCWHADGTRVVTGSSSGEVRVRSAFDGRSTATLDTSQDEEIYGLEMLPGDASRAAVGAGETAQVWGGVRETPRKSGVFGLWRPLSRSDSSRFGSFLDR